MTAVERDAERVAESDQGSLREVSALMFRLGWTAFGGPAAHIAMLRDEVVVRRNWLDDRRFVDLLGAANLIPGPTSTEMVMHVSHSRAGWRGFFAGGLLFIVPAVALVLGFAWLYVEHGSRPAVEWLLYGIKPVVIAIVVQAMLGLARTAIRGLFLAALGVAILALSLLGASELALLAGGAIVVMLARNWRRLVPGAACLAPPGALKLPAFAAVAAVAAEPYSATQLFLTFLRVGAVLYGSGYVLVAFLRGDFVDRLGWLTEEQLLDAVAVGQFTPGPVFTTATFVGYVAGGFSGALLATVAIFLPAFAFVALSVPLLPRLRSSPWTAAALDGVNVAAIALMASVAWDLGSAAIVDPLTAALAVGAVVLLTRWRVNSAWLVLAGGVIGGMARWLGG